MGGVCGRDANQGDCDTDIGNSVIDQTVKLEARVEIHFPLPHVYVEYAIDVSDHPVGLSIFVLHEEELRLPFGQHRPLLYRICGL